MKHLLFLLLLSNTLFAQEVFWQNYLSVEHPLTGATDTAWFGIGDVDLGYNPYLDSLFYGNTDSVPDIRILGFDSGEYSSSVCPLQATHCGNLHRNIRPLKDNASYYNVRFFEFMVWVDESGFGLTQHARLNIDTTPIIELLHQNVAAQWNLPHDSVFISSFEINLLEDIEHQGQSLLIIENANIPYYNADWESDYIPSFILFPPGYDDNNFPNGRGFII